MYGINNYGVIKYTENSPNEEDVKKYKIDLNKYVPEYLRDIKELKAIYDAQGAELGSFNYYLDDFKKQFSVITATWGLSFWEEEFGVETNLNLGYEDRREVILAKIRGQGITTKEMIKEVAKSFTGGDVNIIEDNEKSKFIVQFIGIKGIPKNLEGFKNMIEDIKPAHLEYELKYTYTEWNELKSLSWNNAKLKTWNEIKIYE